MNRDRTGKALIIDQLTTQAALGAATLEELIPVSP
jgi:hypothetical protein